MGFLELVQAFVRVAEGGSLTAAASQIKRSVGATSRQISQLEDQLGSVLLVRSARGVRLTQAGHQFLTSARSLLAAAEHARRSVAPDHALTGRIVLTTSVTWAMERVVPTLSTIRKRAPRLELVLRLEDHTIDLIAEGVDIAIRSGMMLPDSTRYVARRLEVVSRVLVAAPALLATEGAIEQPRDLAQRSCLCAGDSLAERTWRLEGPTGDVAVEVSGALFTRTVLALRDAAIAGLGVAMVPRFMAQSALARGRLVEVLPDWRPADVGVHAVYRIELRQDPRIQFLCDVLIHAANGDYPSP